MIAIIVRTGSAELYLHRIWEKKTASLYQKNVADRLINNFFFSYSRIVFLAGVVFSYAVSFGHRGCFYILFSFVDPMLFCYDQ